MRTVRLAHKMRPLLARIRQRREGRQALQIRRTDSTPPPSPLVGSTSEQFMEKQPRDVELFDWSTAKVVPLRVKHLFGRYIDSLWLRRTTEAPERTNMSNAALRVLQSRPHQGAVLRLSQRTTDGFLFFALGVSAPTVIRWGLQGCASLFAASG